MPHGYGYGNARLRAMRSRLLTGADYRDLLARTNIEELITALTETPYKPDIELALLRADGLLCVYEAARTNLTRTLIKIRGFFEGKPLALFELLLRRWDRHNLLTILRGQSQEVTSDEVLAVVVPVGQIDMVALRELARQPSIQAVIDLMVAWRLPYAQTLRRARASAGTAHTLDQIELALNRFFYASIRDALQEQDGHNGRIALEYFRTEIDLVNLSTVLRLAYLPDIGPLVQQRYDADDIQPLLIDGGYLAPTLLAQLITETGSLEGLVQHLDQTRYRPALEAGWRRYQAEHNIAVFERELERWQAEQAQELFSRDALSIAIPIGYLISKHVEISNLRLIAQAVTFGVQRDRVRRDLIMVR